MFCCSRRAFDRTNSDIIISIRSHYHHHMFSPGHRQQHSGIIHLASLLEGKLLWKKHTLSSLRFNLPPMADPLAGWSTTRPVHVFLDFDGTITKQDTIGALGNFASGVNSKKSTWLSHCNWYQKEGETLTKAYPISFTSTAALENLGPLGMKDRILGLLNAGVHLERLSVQLINNYRIFGDLPPHILYEAAQSLMRSKDSADHIEIRDGFGDLLKYLAAKNSGATVLSVNWSDDWIKGCISPYRLDVISNTIRYGKIVGPGPELTNDPSGLLLTGDHKLAAMMAARKRLPTHGTDMEYVYIGDSMTDLPCMLECDKAIIMVNEDPGLKHNYLVDALVAMGNQVKHICNVGPTFRYAWAKDFTEILRSGNLYPGVRREPTELDSAFKIPPKPTG